MPAETSFQPRTSIEQVEEGPGLAPRFDEHGLLPCVTTDATSGEVLMLGWMNAEALQRTLTKLYRAIDPDTGALRFVEQEKAFDPRVVDGDAPNPTLL